MRGILVALLLLAGCATIPPGPAPIPPPAVFSHADFDRVLQRFVDDQGRVDYAGLQADPGDLDRYYAQVAAWSPDNAPALFPSRDDRLAYWLNAYNAAVLRTLLAYYPVASVDAIPPWLPSKFGFFILQRFTVGGETTNLYTLENALVRERYKDPRIHFALNCASAGCPRLPRRAFTGAALPQQLEAETRHFVAAPRNVRVDDAARTVWLSSIFNWYVSDFLDWPPLGGRAGATLLDYVALYAEPAQADALRRAAVYEVRFTPYDWRLNDQAQ